MALVKIKATDGTQITFDDKMIGQGGVKDVYFTEDRRHVVGFFRNKLDVYGKERLEHIVGKYRDSIFSQDGGEYWKNLFCWPEKIVEYNGKTGVLVPTYAQEFFFTHGSSTPVIDIKGREKEGKWFANPWHRYCNLDKREIGDWRSYLNICLLISRAIRRMHAAGLSHSDLSYKNILIDPVSVKACIIDIDGLVVPGKFPPDVVGTPDFIAPEVMQTLKLKICDPAKKIPKRETDMHALAVLIYMYLLCRHPLRGKKVHDMNDENRDEELAMGEKALFVESDKDTSNRYDIKWVKKNEPANRYPYIAPWMDLDKRPYTILGPYISQLVRQAFMDGLHNPSARPSANDWEDAIVRTIDLLQPCQNPKCEQKWFVFDNTTKPICPFCNTVYKGMMPVLNFYSKRGSSFKLDNHRLMVFNGTRIYPWHVNRNVFPNEKLKPDQKKAVAYFQFHNNFWYLVNQSIPKMIDITDNKKIIKPNEHIQLTEGRQILLSEDEGGRLIQVQLVQN